MTIEVVFKCDTCADRNKSMMRMPGYKWKTDSWTTFSDAVEHLKKKSDYSMRAVVDIEVSVS